MQAIQGTYNNGTIILHKKAPKPLSKVIVIFTEEPFAEDDMSTEEALSIVKKYSGCIKGDFDTKAEMKADGRLSDKEYEAFSLEYEQNPPRLSGKPGFLT